MAFMHTAFFRLEAGHTIFFNVILSGLLLVQNAASGRLRPKIAEAIKRLFIVYRFISILAECSEKCVGASRVDRSGARWGAARSLWEIRYFLPDFFRLSPI